MLETATSLGFGVAGPPTDGHARAAFRRAEQVGVARRIAEGDRAAGVHERSRRLHAGGRGDPSEVGRRERRRPDERTGRAVFDQEHVDAERIDGSCASARNPFANPVRTSVIAKMMAVDSTAMTKRRFRHCMSRSAASSM